LPVEAADGDKPMRQFLVIGGAALLIAGLAWPWISRFPFGHLPGDIHIERDGFSFYFPLTTCLLVSVIFAILLWIFRR
jgi:hypothetical protein